jgi:hypothetical protein
MSWWVFEKRVSRSDHLSEMPLYAHVVSVDGGSIDSVGRMAVPLGILLARSTS